MEVESETVSVHPIAHRVVFGSWRLALVACVAVLDNSSVWWLQGQLFSVQPSDWYQTGAQDSELYT